MSIPDYAYTPFGVHTGDTAQIRSEINQYNAFNKYVSDTTLITYIDITPVSELGLQYPSYIASDSLHPSGQQYAQWVSLMLKEMHREVLTGLPSNMQFSKTEFNIYPNPGQIFFISDKSGNLASAIVEIFNAAGVLMLKKEFKVSGTILDLSNCEEGLYTCRISNAITSKSAKLLVTK